MPKRSLVKELNQYPKLPDKLRFLGARIRESHPVVQRFSVALYQPATGKLRSFFSTSPDREAITHYEFPLAEATSLRQLAQQKHPRIINDLSVLAPSEPQEKINSHTQKVLQQGWKASFTCPLLAGDELLGFVFFNSPTAYAFRGKLLEELEVYSQLIAQLVDQDHAGIRTLTACVRSMMSLCAGRDPETGGHLERMAEYAQLIALHLVPKWTFSDRQIQHLHLFAPLHDLGKLAIADRILLKPGKLTEQEFQEMQKHPQRGVELLDQVIAWHGLERLPDVKMLKNIVLYHHEKMDGSGYPFGLSGEAIPIEARIIAVADVLDALTSERPYKKAWPLARALEELKRLAGKELDADCVEVVISQQQQAQSILEQSLSDVVDA